MREIKFRVWVEAPDSEKAMHYPKLISFGSGKLSWATLKDDSVIKDNGWYTKREVMQYTGLKDKNGVEIYEGDIVCFENPTNDFYYKGNYEVYWDFSRWYMRSKDGEFNNGDYYRGNEASDGDWSRTEVIGNIYENPELLK